MPAMLPGELLSRPSAGLMRLLDCLCAGLALGLAELVLVVIFDGHLFLSWIEASRYLVAGPLGLATALVVSGALLSGISLALRRMPVVGRLLAVAAMSWPLFVWALWELTAGRRLRDLPMRPTWVATGGALAGLGLSASALYLERLSQVDAARRRRWSIALGALTFGLLAVDGLVLRRLYPALHWLLSGLAVLAALAAGLLERPSVRVIQRVPRRVRPVLVAFVLSGPLWLVSLHDAPNMRFALEQAAPITGKALAWLPRRRSVGKPPPVADAPAEQRGLRPGVDLRGRDVLLLSVDALRADRLQAYGGTGLTPGMDALAGSGVVFTRAYTTTPHTSYAIASLMTGKYMRGVMELAQTATEHKTLPEVLRRYGYRTAAFYPPAIFFVDQARFSDLSARQLGFEYAKVMFADGADRVAQLERYLNGEGAGHLTFAWVHLFEPHEPYAPAAAFARGDSPEARYDGEVAQADAAVADLVATFRRLRPNSLIVLTADHGEEFDDHGGRYHGTTLFDEQVRVPLVFSAPGVLAARQVSVAVDAVDVVTTILGVLGMPRDVRMRGDDLSPLLLGAPATGSELAFAALDDARMVMDGRFKAICLRDGGCSLYDLARDPGERRDLSGSDPGTLARLQAGLSEFVASIPRVEAMAMAGGGAIPVALARAELGDPGAGPALVPLLGSTRPSVRAAAARALGTLQQRAALPVLARLAERDPDVHVRAEAAIARLSLGQPTVLLQVRALLGAAPPDVERRAALALATAGEVAGTSVLLAMAVDEQLDETGRLAAIAALGRLRLVSAIEPLVGLLSDVRLRAPVADALATIGGVSVADALAEALETERYPAARAAEVRGLLHLGDRRGIERLQHFLGTESGVPGGLAMLRDAGALSASVNGRSAASTPSIRRGNWRCDKAGCWPGVSARLVPPRAPAVAGARLLLAISESPEGAVLRVMDHRISLTGGAQELSVALAHPPRAIPVAADPGVLIGAFLCVPSRTEPPLPEPEGPPPGLVR